MSEVHFLREELKEKSVSIRSLIITINNQRNKSSEKTPENPVPNPVPNPVLNKKHWQKAALK